MEFLSHEKQILEYAQKIQAFRDNQHYPLLSSVELKQLEEKLEKLREKIYSSLSPWERVEICRHPQRPHSRDYIDNLCEEFVELKGDRLFREDPSVVSGIGRIGQQSYLILGQEKGKDTQSRLHHNFGMVHPEGFRKVLRLAKFAEKFELPILLLLDTPGAYPGLSAEERGQSWAIAQNLRDFFSIKTHIFVVVIGEGCSGGALGMGVGDTIAMLEHSYYSVISPEGCASILWKDAQKKQEAAATLKMHPEHLLAYGIIDAVIPEPLGGAHHHPEKVYQEVKKFLVDSFAASQGYCMETLLEHRYRKFRNIGAFTLNEAAAQSCSS